MWEGERGEGEVKEKVKAKAEDRGEERGRLCDGRCTPRRIWYAAAPVLCCDVKSERGWLVRCGEAVQVQRGGERIHTPSRHSTRDESSWNLCLCFLARQAQMQWNNSKNTNPPRDGLRALHSQEDIQIAVERRRRRE